MNYRSCIGLCDNSVHLYSTILNFLYTLMYRRQLSHTLPHSSHILSSWIWLISHARPFLHLHLKPSLSKTYIPTITISHSYSHYHLAQQRKHTSNDGDMMKIEASKTWRSKPSSRSRTIEAQFDGQDSGCCTFPSRFKARHNGRPLMLNAMTEIWWRCRSGFSCNEMIYFLLLIYLYIIKQGK